MDQILKAFADPILKALPALPKAIIAFVIGYIFVFIIGKIIKSGLKYVKTTQAVRQIITSMMNVVLWTILLALVFQSLGLSQVALALSGSVALFGILLASGANFLVSDILSGIFLAKDPDFKIGEMIKTTDFEGRVEFIDLRKVRLRDKDGHLHIVPNSVLDRTQFVVLDVGKK